VQAPPVERVGIIGFGLIGGSIALAAKRCWPSIAVTVCDPSPLSAEAVSQGLVAGLVGTPADLRDCDLIVIATPVTVVSEILGQLSSAGVAALVTDVSATKRVVMEAARVRAAAGPAFFGGHPVVETTGEGLGAARADLFDGRAWLLVSSTSREDVREAMLATFVIGLGARPEWTDAVTHDRVVAHVSHAPHLVSMALAAAGATGATDERTTTRAASSAVWQGIVDTNADFIADALTALAAKLPTSADALTNTPEVRDVFERAQALRSAK
jgi:prephenate dehydrogenase